MSKEKPVLLPEMCGKHVYSLVHQAKYLESDPWRALVIVSQLALFQAATCDSAIQAKVGGDVYKISTLGCLACLKPDSFGEIVEAAKTRDLKDIKELGERWVKEAAKPS